MNRKQIGKNVADLKYTRDMIGNTPYGSFVEAVLYGMGKEWTDGYFVQRFKRAKLPTIDDPDFLMKMIRAFHFDPSHVKKCSMAIYRDESNTLFWPVAFTNGYLVPIPYKMIPRTVAKNIDHCGVINWD